MDALLNDVHDLYEYDLTIVPLGSPNLKITPYFKSQCKDEAEAKEKWPKSPLVGWKKYQGAKTEEKDFESWLQFFPGCNWAIITGNEINVVDADSVEAIKWIEENITHTPWRCRTAKGKHYYYRVNKDIPVRNSVGKNKVDLRGEGGYVVAPGSVHSTGTIYEFESDDGIANLISDLPFLSQDDLDKIKKYNSTKLSVVGNDENIPQHDTKKDTLAPAGEGERNNRLTQIAGYLIAAQCNLRETKQLLDRWNQTNPVPLSQTEVNTTLASIVNTHFRNNPQAAVKLEPSNDVLEIKKAIKTKIQERRFPDECMVLPGPLNDIVRYINETARKPQPLFAIAAALSLGGVIAGRKYQTETRLRLNQYFVCLGKTGCGKDHARKIIKKILKESGHHDYIGGDDIASGQGLLAAVHRQPNIIFNIDEIGDFLEQVASPGGGGHLALVLTNLMKLYSSSSSEYSGTERADQRMNPRSQTVIEYPCAHVYATGTGEIFYPSLESARVVSGFLNRMLVIETENNFPAPQKVVSKEVPESILNWIDEITDRTIINGPGIKKAQIGMTPDNPLTIHQQAKAYAHLEDYERICTQRMQQYGDNPVGVMWVRAFEHASKIASILALAADSLELRVTIDNAEWATKFVDYIIYSMIDNIELKVADSRQEAEQKMIESIIKESNENGIGRSALLKRSKMRSRQLDDIVKTLIECELVFQSSEIRGRRAAIIYYHYSVAKYSDSGD